MKAGVAEDLCTVLQIKAFSHFPFINAFLVSKQFSRAQVCTEIAVGVRVYASLAFWSWRRNVPPKPYSPFLHIKGSVDFSSHSWNNRKTTSVNNDINKFKCYGTDILYTGSLLHWHGLLEHLLCSEQYLRFSRFGKSRYLQLKRSQRCFVNPHWHEGPNIKGNTYCSTARE